MFSDASGGNRTYCAFRSQKWVWRTEVRILKVNQHPFAQFLLWGRLQLHGVHKQLGCPLWLQSGCKDLQSNREDWDSVFAQCGRLSLRTHGLHSVFSWQVRSECCFVPQYASVQKQSYQESFDATLLPRHCAERRHWTLSIILAWNFKRCFLTLGPQRFQKPQETFL